MSPSGYPFAGRAERPAACHRILRRHHGFFAHAAGGHPSSRHAGTFHGSAHLRQRAAGGAHRLLGPCDAGRPVVTIRKKTNGSCCWKAPPGWALTMAVKYPWNAASVCYCLSMCAIVYWRPASPVSGWPSTRRSCARRKPTARPPVRRDSVAPAPFSPARG